MAFVGGYLRSPRVKCAIFAAVLVLILITISKSSQQPYGLLNPISIGGYAPFSNEKSTDEDVRKLTHKTQAHTFWERVFKIIKSNGLKLTSTEIDNAIIYTKDSGEKKMNTREVLLSKANISEKAYQEFKRKHVTLLEELPSDLSPTTYVLNSNGIVFVGGGKFSWLSYLSLLGLRETGSKLPVEIMMPTYSDYDAHIFRL